MKIMIEKELYDKICNITNNPESFCIQAVTKYIQGFSTL